MQSDSNDQKKVVDEIMDRAIELSVENQEILLMMAKAMRYTRDCDQQTLVDLYAEYRDQLVTCDPAEFDRLYEELSVKYLEAGYQAVLDERREAYEAGYSTRLE